jgi:hypothetical protein
MTILWLRVFDFMHTTIFNIDNRIITNDKKEW